MKTKIITDSGFTLPLSNDIAISLNYAIADIREPEKRDGNYSKTITIPSTKVSDVFFKSAFEIDGYDNYNPNLKQKVRITSDDIDVVNGTLQLLKINVIDNKVTYDVAVKGNVLNLFTDIADKLLTDLDLSEFDHPYSKIYQQASWIAAVGSGYVYPMIDYSKTNGLTYDSTNMFPAIYAKTYLDKIFSDAGYSYSSDFLNSDFFKRLIIPYCSDNIRLTPAQITALGVDASITVNQVLSSGTSLRVISFNFETADPSNQYSPAGAVFTALYKGTYNFAVRVDTNSFYSDPYESQIMIRKTTTAVSSFGSQLAANYYSSTQVISGVSHTYFTVDANNILLNPGDTVRVFMNAPTYRTYTLVSGQFIVKSTGDVLNDGNTLLMNGAIPQKIKQKDFLSSLIKMFNLYVDVDKDNPNKIYIEPRDDFYNNGVTLDWTSKLSIDKPIEISPMGELGALRYEFAYKQDKDYWNEKYFASHSESYGLDYVDLINDFVKNTNKTEVIFSPTPLVEIGSTKRIIPQISKLGSSGLLEPIGQFNIRILYYAGTKTCTPWNYTSSVTGTTTEVIFPYAGHVDDVIAPTLDLSFGTPREVYYNTSLYTFNNLYNRFYKKFIEEITDKDSKIITAYLNLKPNDIYTLDFRNQFFIDKHLLRLNKIFDFDPINPKLTKCEFIKIKQAAQYVP